MIISPPARLNLSDGRAHVIKDRASPAFWNFYQQGHALPAAAAKRSDSLSAAAAPQFMGKRQGKPEAGPAEWMTDRDRSAVHIHSFVIDIQCPAARNDYTRKSFIDFK